MVTFSSYQKQNWTYVLVRTNRMTEDRAIYTLWIAEICSRHPPVLLTLIYTLTRMMPSLVTHLVPKFAQTYNFTPASPAQILWSPDYTEFTLM